jgi:hypothetical protein
MDKLIILIATSLALVVSQTAILTGPPQMLTPIGLATPWTNSNNQSVIDLAAFIQGVIFDTATYQIYAYNPLVITVGTSPAIAPTIPKYNVSTSVVALWFGYNGVGDLILADHNNGSDLALGKEFSMSTYIS